jgi:GntR family transcriptional regulator / MocR family aminotransferase
MADLTLSLDYRTATPLYEQLCQFVIGEIRAGRLKEGEKLPSKRALCEHLQISRSTVEAAYEILAAEGYVEARPRSGYYVCAALALEAAPPDRATRLESPGKAPSLAAASPKPDGKASGQGASRPRYDFSTGDVDTSAFPYASWARINREVVQTMPQLLSLGDAQGDWELRSTLCDFLRQYRGVDCGPEQIVLGAGGEYLLDVLLRVMGDCATFALEDPGYGGIYRAVRAAGRTFYAIPLDAQGLDAARLMDGSANVAFVTPSHQFPTGTTMPAGRRAQLIRWAQGKPGRYIIEDDYDSEFRHTTRPIPAMQGVDGDRVVYLGTFSRTIAPSIRASYMVLPGPLLHVYRERYGRSACTLSRFEQQTLRLFLQRGLYARHLRRVGSLYRRRRNLLIDLFSPYPNVHLLGDDAGLHFLMTVDSLPEKALVSKASVAGVKVQGLSEYAFEAQVPPSTLVIGYAGLGEEDIQKASALLVQAWGLGPRRSER